MATDDCIMLRRTIHVDITYVSVAARPLSLQEQIDV